MPGSRSARLPLRSSSWNLPPTYRPRAGKRLEISSSPIGIIEHLSENLAVSLILHRKDASGQSHQPQLWPFAAEREIQLPGYECLNRDWRWVWGVYVDVFHGVMLQFIKRE
jgi:hypothetical protein